MITPETGVIPFAAVLLAGGQSRRMGRDKALLPLLDGRLLWERQLNILNSLGPKELFISGPPREGFPKDVPLLSDERPGLGPLSGIVAALEAMTTLLLVVLAIDLPAMSAPFLRALLASSREETGVVPRHDNPQGYYEPLAAVYPRNCLEVAQEKLRAGKLALQGFVQTASPFLQTHLITTQEKVLFVNWNEPGSLAGTNTPSNLLK